MRIVTNVCSMYLTQFAFVYLVKKICAVVEEHFLKFHQPVMVNLSCQADERELHVVASGVYISIMCKMETSMLRY